MTDTNQLPPLPEPEGVIVVGTQALRGFTADQMRAYALQSRAQLAQGEPVSDEQIDWIRCHTSVPQSTASEELPWTKADARTFARAILALRPAAQTEREAHATARAFSLATMAAEEFVRCNGLSTGEPDEFMMTGPDLTDEHATACVDHLKWVGECVAFDTDDGVLVRLGDFTLGSLS